jgi:hypothetical protein
MSKRLETASYRSFYGLNKKGKKSSLKSGPDTAKSGIGKRWPDYPPPPKKAAR